MRIGVITFSILVNEFKYYIRRAIIAVTSIASRYIEVIIRMVEHMIA